MPSKYHNRHVVVDGYTFDSAAEAKRYGELKILEFARRISQLRIHPHWDCVHAGVKICRYEADFQYWDEDVGEWIVEDVKGVATSVYRLKKKLMKALFNISIVEIPA